MLAVERLHRTDTWDTDECVGQVFVGEGTNIVLRESIRDRQGDPAVVHRFLAAQRCAGDLDGIQCENPVGRGDRRRLGGIGTSRLRETRGQTDQDKDQTSVNDLDPGKHTSRFTSL